MNEGCQRGYGDSMNFEELRDFVENKMQMSHVYQPLLIRLLVDAGGQATVRQLAKELSAVDEAQILFYADRLKKMPIPVLTKRRVASRTKELVSLSVDELTLEQRRVIIAACEARIAQFVAKRGIGAWSNFLELEPVEESVRYEVLKRDRRCVLCGAGRDDEMLQVDHIVPRSKGGSNKISNLQTLCAPCNRGKSNRDATDLR